MLAALTQLLLFQLLGEVLTRVLALPVPGPVIGMVLLFGFLVLRRGPGRELQSTAQGLLQHLSLLFVPAGTGIILHLHRLREEWLAITVALLLSTFITLAVTALLLKLLTRHRHPDDAQSSNSSNSSNSTDNASTTQEPA